MKKWLMLICFSAVFLSGCSMLELKQTADQQIPELHADSSRIVFMRSAFHGAAITAMLYEIIDGKPKYFGAVKNDNKFYLDTTPGQHIFMALGMGADFMPADLAPGKTYYVMVTPRGWPSISFSLHPFRTDGTTKFNTDSDSFKDWKNATILVENLPQSYTWAEERQQRADDAYKSYWPKWQKKSENDKQVYTIYPSDGM